MKLSDSKVRNLKPKDRRYKAFDSHGLHLIVVIEKGRIIACDSHEELMQLDGHYARLFSLQAKGRRWAASGI